MSIRRGLTGLAVVLIGWLGLLALGAGPAHAGPVLPTQDSFYSYTGSLASVANGTVLRTRSVSFDASGLTVPVTSHQVLFRTTDEQGTPIVAVTTVVQPVTGASGKIASYQWAYDGLASNCEPSYAIQGGTPTEGTNADEQNLSVPLLAAGDTLVITDYESEDNDFAAGREEGQITLDGIRAAENLLSDTPTSTPVALIGYSGGAIASDWAAELAPSYAPSLDIVGDAMGGIAVDLDHNLDYVNGSQEWSGAIPAALIGISRGFDIDLSPYLSSYGQKVVTAVGGTCLESDLGTYPGLTLQKMLKPQYTNVDQIPPFVSAINTLIMGTGGVPREPMFIGVGDADGTGDDVMVDADDEALATKYCSEGLPVEFQTYQGQDHSSAGLEFLPQGIAWAIRRLDGVAPENGCASIPEGDSLAPLTAVNPSSPHSAPHSRLELQYRSAHTRVVHLRLRAVGARITGIRVELLNARGRVLASRRITAAKGKLVLVSLTTRARLGRGTYRILARQGSHTLASARFRIGRH